MNQPDWTSWFGVGTLLAAGLWFVGSDAHNATTAQTQRSVERDGSQLYMVEETLTPAGVVETNRQLLPQPSKICISDVGVNQAGQYVRLDYGLGTSLLLNTEAIDPSC